MMRCWRGTVVVSLFAISMIPSGSNEERSFYCRFSVPVLEVSLLDVRCGL